MPCSTGSWARLRGGRSPTATCSSSKDGQLAGWCACGGGGENAVAERHVHLEALQHRAPLAALARDPRRMADARRLVLPGTEDPADLVVVRAIEIGLAAAIERVPGDARAAFVDLQA